MKPTHPCPDDTALFLGSSTTANGTYDFWIHQFRPVDEVYAFAVSDDSGSFATITLPYSTDGYPQRHNMGQNACWVSSNDKGQRLSMFVPTSSHYLGLEALVYEWLWLQLYGGRFYGGFGTDLHPASETLRHAMWKAEHQLRKAGHPLNDEQLEILFPF